MASRILRNTLWLVVEKLLIYIAVSFIIIQKLKDKNSHNIQINRHGLLNFGIEHG